MTGFGIYLVIYYVLNMLSAIFYIGRGKGMTVSEGALWLSFVWCFLNLLGVLYIGTGLGVLDF